MKTSDTQTQMVFARCPDDYCCFTLWPLHCNWQNAVVLLRASRGNAH